MFDFESLRTFLLDTREEQHKSREQIAAIIGITVEALRNFEMGPSHMKVDNIMSLLDAYGLSGAVLDEYYTRSERMQMILDVQEKEQVS